MNNVLFVIKNYALSLEEVGQEQEKKKHYWWAIAIKTTAKMFKSNGEIV